MNDCNYAPHNYSNCDITMTGSRNAIITDSYNVVKTTVLTESKNIIHTFL